MAHRSVLTDTDRKRIRDAIDILQSAWPTIDQRGHAIRDLLTVLNHDEAGATDRPGLTPVPSSTPKAFRITARDGRVVLDIDPDTNEVHWINAKGLMDWMADQFGRTPKDPPTPSADPAGPSPLESATQILTEIAKDHYARDPIAGVDIRYDLAVVAGLLHAVLTGLSQNRGTMLTHHVSTALDGAPTTAERRKRHPPKDGWRS